MDANQKTTTEAALDLAAALGFIKTYTDATGLKSINLVALKPEGGLAGAQQFLAGQKDGISAWLRAADSAEHNIYYVVNGVRPDKHGKPKKEDMVRLVASWVDIDADAEIEKAGGLASERDRIMKLIEELTICTPFAPSYVVDTGGGYQAHWLWDEPMVARIEDGKMPDAVKEMWEKWIAEGERASERLGKALGGDAVENVDRIMRLPGCRAFPNSSKQKKRGRHEIFQTRLVDWFGEKYDRKAFTSWAETFAKEKGIADDGASAKAKATTS